MIEFKVCVYDAAIDDDYACDIKLEGVTVAGQGKVLMSRKHRKELVDAARELARRHMVKEPLWAVYAYRYTTERVDLILNSIQSIYEDFELYINDYKKEASYGYENQEG